MTTKLLNGIQCVILLVFVFIVSCEYIPKGENEIKLTPKTIAPPLNVDLNFDSDTVLLPTNSAPKFRFVSPDTLVKRLNVYVDGTLYTTISSNKGEFPIYLNAFSENTGHVLKLEFFSSSGTGSMADKIGAEGFLYSKTWVLIFKYSLIGPYVSKFTPIDGTLKIEWSRFKGVGFKKYLIGHSGSDPYSVKDTIAIISDINTTFCFDNTFVGTLRQFTLITITDDNIYYGYSGFSDLPKTATVISNIEGDFIISWPSNKYKSNLIGYKIFASEGGYNRGVEIATILDSTMASYTFKGGSFASYQVFYIMPLAKRHPVTLTNQDQISDFSTISNQCYRGLGILNYHDFFCPLGDYFYCSDGEYLIKYNTNSLTLQKVMKMQGNAFRPSPDGKLLMSQHKGKFDVYDSNNMTLLASDSVKDITGFDRDLGTYVISNNGIGIIPVLNFYVYDFLHHKKIAEFKINNAFAIGSFNDWFRISPNGDYCLFRYCKTSYQDPVTSLFKIENDTAKIIWEKDTPFADFDPLNPQNIYYYYGTKFTTMSLSSLTIQKELDLDADWISCADFANNELLGISKDNYKIFIYDMNTGVKKYQLPVPKQYYIFEFKLKNKIVIWTGGYLMKLNY